MTTRQFHFEMSAIYETSVNQTSDMEVKSRTPRWELYIERGLFRSMHSLFVPSVAVGSSISCRFAGNRTDVRSGRCRLYRAPHRAHVYVIKAEAEVVVADILTTAEEKMDKTIDSIRSSFNTIRTGRANTGILDRIVVMYYEVETPLKQLASVSVSGSSTLVIDPYDKSCIGDIERALLESDVGITPGNDGSVIRLAVPPLTQERRKELTKKAKAMAEEGRVALRNVRREAIDKLKKLEKDSDIGKDESKMEQDKVQKATDSYAKKIDGLFKEKEGELMKV